MFYPHLIVILQIKTTMKYFEFTFDTNPCTETVNDVLFWAMPGLKVL